MAMPKSPGGAYFRLEGDTCGHVIDVLVHDHGVDAERIVAAMDSNEPHAQLNRLCPFCRARREFKFPLVLPELPKPLSLLYEPVAPCPQLEITRIGDWFDAPTPPERAFRLWERGRERAATDPEAARRDLSLAADIFDRERMWMQHEGAKRDLDAISGTPRAGEGSDRTPNRSGWYLMDKKCHDCGVCPGEMHHPGCDTEICPMCGKQAITCRCVYVVNGVAAPRLIPIAGPTEAMWAKFDAEIEKIGGRLPWTGVSPGTAECIEYGWFSRWVEGTGYVECKADDPNAGPDLNRLLDSARWDPTARRWVR